MFENILSLWPEPVLLQMLLIVFLSFLLEDPTTVLAGGLVSLGKISFMEGFFALTLGIFFGDILLYLLGVAIRRGLIRKELNHYSKKMPYSFIFFARFIPGFRFVTYTAAGYLKKNFNLFLLIACVASLVWSFLLLKISKETMDHLFKSYGLLTWAWLAAIVVFFWSLERGIGRLIARKRCAE